MGWAETRTGPERAKGTCAFRSLLDSGAVLAFDFDAFVGWVPEQKTTVAQAIHAYTMGSA